MEIKSLLIKDTKKKKEFVLFRKGLINAVEPVIFATAVTI